MALRIAIQMDPVASLNAKGDSTLAMGIEAQRRGHTLFYYTPDRLTLHNGRTSAKGHPIRLFPNPAHYYELGAQETLDLASMDVVLLRQDPPFHMAYLTTTYLLEMLPQKTLVVNNPASVRNHPEKLFPELLRQFMPETLVSADADEIRHFHRRHKDIIIKPLYGYAGRSVLRFTEHDGNLDAILEMHLSSSREPLLAQRFLPEVKAGDRRIIMMNGKVCGVFARIPAGLDIRANLRVGGTAAKAELTKRQREACEALGPILKQKGIFFAGVDMIGDYLTEVNVTSPTGLVQVRELYGTKPEAELWDAIEMQITSR